jgi:hypothetical protein
LLLHPAAKPVVFVLCLLPLAWLVLARPPTAGRQPGRGADPLGRGLDAAHFCA